jgi:dolichol-phosphate mannosyltransferase
MTVASFPRPALSEALERPKVTVVVPTYREVESIPHLVTRLQKLGESSGLDLEVLFMDDDSRDGSEELVASLGLPWIRMVSRKVNRGLIPEMLAALDDGMEVVVGSRFTDGGSTADDWGLLRWLNSRLATLLALPFTSLSDPMSGFFAIRRATFLAGRDFNPVGYKILLELIIKCRCRRVLDIPIHFDNRRFGESKLSFKEQLKYIQHLRRLYIYKYGTWSHLIQFLVVGISGLVINLGSLTVLLHMRVAEKQAVATAIIISMIWNFILNRRFSFSYARKQSIVAQFLGFVAACSVGAVVNYFMTTGLWEVIRLKQVAALIGVLAGTFFNFVASRFVIFRSKHVKA